MDMVKHSPNPPQSGHKSRVEALETKKDEDAATRALDYYLNPKPSPPPEADKSQLFIVAPHVDTETLLANASEDLLSISTLAADLADDVEDSRRSVALGRMGFSCWLNGRWIVWKRRKRRKQWRWQARGNCKPGRSHKWMKYNRER